MLNILIHNIGTNENNIADYYWTASINDVVIKTGNIFGHDRNKGWEHLLLELVESNRKTNVSGKKRGQTDTIYIDREEDKNE